MTYHSAPDSREFSALAPVGGFAKRTFDICFASVALLALSPLCLLIALTMAFCARGPVFFRHERVGFDGRIFKCIKFRTMVVDADERLAALLAGDDDARREFEETRKLKNDPRIIPVVGLFLRSSSLDEIPQFINVLRGDMSIVGPRPVTREELLRYGKAQPTYLSVRPGITGLWQVSGRNQLSFDERVAIDKSYVMNWRFWADLRIIYRTFDVVFKRHGAY